MINKKCLACNGFQHDCVGSNLSCGKFSPLEFDESHLAMRPEIDNDLPITAPEPGESRQQKFVRIGEKRKANVLEAIRKLQHLTSCYYRNRDKVTIYSYEWTAQDAEEILEPIEQAIADLRKALTVPVCSRENGLTDGSPKE
jgi:hypothetical protein